MVDGSRPAARERVFPGVGIELEYMVVDETTGDVLPVVDEVLRCEAGEITSDVEFEDVCWSNELVLHVIELKTNGPTASLDHTAAAFQEHVNRVNQLLQPMSARLMPGGMHPWMDPARDTRLWPHDYSIVYQAFDRVFGCSGHGWANLQSVHLNLPFADGEQFGRLHAAIRLVLPILPALTASSPVMEGRVTGLLDNRLNVYRTNCARVPSLTGLVIPEPVFTIADYKSRILEKLYRDLSPYDPEGVLQEEFVNARGAIARFVRDTIEIRVMDVQECPAADVAVCDLVIATIEALMHERWTSLPSQQQWSVEPLAGILLGTMADAERATIGDPAYLELFGMPAETCTPGELWRHIASDLSGHLDGSPDLRAARTVVLERGPLARRLLAALGDSPNRDRLVKTYGRLADCLRDGQAFLP